MGGWGGVWGEWAGRMACMAIQGPRMACMPKGIQGVLGRSRAGLGASSSSGFERLSGLGAGSSSDFAEW